MNVEFISDSAESTSRLGQYFASFLNGGDTIILTGDLGGGKTTFISGIAKGLGVGQDVSSPSFTLVNEYSAGSKKLIHADLYRLDGAEEIAGIGMDDYIYDPDNIVCIEWGDKMDSFLPPDFIRIHFSYIMDSESKRRIRFSSDTNCWDHKMARFKTLVKRKGLP